jgi:hypothetical protein
MGDSAAADTPPPASASSPAASRAPERGGPGHGRRGVSTRSTPGAGRRLLGRWRDGCTAFFETVSRRAERYRHGWTKTQDFASTSMERARCIAKGARRLRRGARGNLSAQAVKAPRAYSTRPGRAGGKAPEQEEAPNPSPWTRAAIVPGAPDKGRPDSRPPSSPAAISGAAVAIADKATPGSSR